jgi:hypothetical protein
MRVKWWGSAKDVILKELRRAGVTTPSRLRASIGNGSRDLDYCQGTVFN